MVSFEPQWGFPKLGIRFFICGVPVLGTPYLGELPNVVGCIELGPSIPHAEARVSLCCPPQRAPAPERKSLKNVR